MVYFFTGQILGQWNFIIKKFFERFICLIKLLYLSFLRAYKIFMPRNFFQFIFYCVWLFFGLGWRRYSVNFFRYYKSIFSFCLRFVIMCVVSIILFMNLKNLDFFEQIFNLFSTRVVSEKGYLPYAIVASCLLIWFSFLGFFVYFKSFRYFLSPYVTKIFLLNLVVLVILLSIFARAGRAKFGIRVWYPTSREYGGRLGFEFWD